MNFHKNKTDIYCILSLLVLTIVCYWKILDNYLYLDDTMTIFAGYLLSHDITKIFTYKFGYIDGSHIRRVFVALSYVPNYLISGAEPWSYLLVNLLIYFGNSVLIYLILKEISGKRDLSLLISILFTASLNKFDMVGGRNMLMGVFFSLLSMNYYVRIVMEGYNKRLFLYSLISFAVAIGSYEISLVMPAVFVSFGLIFKGKAFFRKDLVIINSVFAGIVIALAWYLNLGSGAVSGNIITESSLAGKIYHIARNILSVFPSFIIPPFFLQSPYEPYHNATSYFGWIETLSLLLILIIFFVNMLLLKDRLIYFALLFFFITAVPISVPRWAYYPELPYQDIRFALGRYSYLPSLGFYMIAGVFLYRFYEYLRESSFNKLALKAVSASLIAAYLAFNIYWLYERERMWDNITDKARCQIDYLKSLNLKVDRDTNIFVDLGFVLYHNHARSILRVIYDNPELNVRDVRDYNPELATGKNLLLFADGCYIQSRWIY